MGIAFHSGSQQDSGDEANDLDSIDAQTELHQAVIEYLKVEHDDDKFNTIHAILESCKISEEVFESQKENIFEIICRMKPKKNANMNIQVDRLLDVFINHGIDLNDRNKNGETLLILACKHKRFDIVRRLLKLTSREFVLDIDAVDNLDETALMKAKQNKDSKIVAAFLICKLEDAIEAKNEDIVISILDEIRNIPQHIFKARDTQFEIWRDVIYIAMEKDTKHSEEILKHLLDYDIILSLEAKIGNPILHRLISSEKEVHDKKLRLIEMLLKSGKINVNATDEEGNTALHLVEEEKVTSLLIGYGAEVNKKDKDGTTPIMRASWEIHGETPSVLQTMLEEAGALLDSSNCRGRTALMKAVMLNNSDVVGMLLDAGASCNLSDHLGYTALHHALRGDKCNHVEFPRNSEELKKTIEMAIFFDAEKPPELSKRCHWYRRNKEWNAERRKTVEMLLQRPNIDVNALSFEKFSPLDIVEGWIPQLPSSIANDLKEKAAVSNVFRETESQSTVEFHPDFRCMLTLRIIVCQVLYSRNEKEVDFLKDRLLALIQTHREKIIRGKDQQGRTALHLTVISFHTLVQLYGDKICDMSNTIVKELISLGCNVNETDIYGRTPLHYANKFIKDFLIFYGADESIKDKDGKRAHDQTSERDDSDNASNVVKAVCDQSGETYSLHLINNKHIEMYISYDDSQLTACGDSALEFWRKEVDLKTAPRLLWDEGKYAFRHPLVDQITKEVTDLMGALVKEIERLDPRFEINPMFVVGSSNEGTKLNGPHEFDFCLVLIKISELCEVYQSPELPNGFVRLKRKPITEDEASDFDSFFGTDETLNTDKLNWQFTTVLRNALVNIENQLSFEWNLTLDYQDIFSNLKKALSFNLMNPLNSTSVDIISIDIVPCIHVDGWWPDEAISNVSDDISKFGCNLVFDRPQELYPWVPYSESCARISFSKAESDMIKESCDSAKEAYMIGKTVILSRSKYCLKNSLLYCIEALTPNSGKASQLGLSLEEMKFKFREMDRYLWLKCLMKCHLEFVSQDFCPCYFLPNFSSPIHKEHLKKSSMDWIWPNDSQSSYPGLCKDAYALYRCTSSDTPEHCCQLPAPDLLWERFDRNKLIASLCEIAYK